MVFFFALKLEAQKGPLFKTDSNAALLTFGKERGLYIASSLGILVNPQTNYGYPLSIQNTLGIQWNKHIITGVGAGLEKFDVPMIPIFLDGRYNLNKTDHPIFVNIKSGYAIGINPQNQIHDALFYYPNYRYKGGYCGFIGTGYTSKLTEALSIEMSIGYRYQQSISIEKDYQYILPEFGDAQPLAESKYIKTFHRLEMRFGFYFR